MASHCKFSKKVSMFEMYQFLQLMFMCQMSNMSQLDVLLSLF